jgi:hypothetical protein
MTATFSDFGLGNDPVLLRFYDKGGLIANEKGPATNSQPFEIPYLSYELRRFGHLPEKTGLF